MNLTTTLYTSESLRCALIHLILNCLSLVNIILNDMGNIALRCFSNYKISKQTDIKIDLTMHKTACLKMLNDFIMLRYLLPRTELAISIYTSRRSTRCCKCAYKLQQYCSSRVVTSSASISGCSHDKSKSNKVTQLSRIPF